MNDIHDFKVLDEHDGICKWYRCLGERRRFHVIERCDRAVAINAPDPGRYILWLVEVDLDLLDGTPALHFALRYNDWDLRADGSVGDASDGYTYARRGFHLNDDPALPTEVDIVLVNGCHMAGVHAPINVYQTDEWREMFRLLAGESRLLDDPARHEQVMTRELNDDHLTPRAIMLHGYGDRRR